MCVPTLLCGSFARVQVVESVHASFQGPQLKRYSIVGEVRLIPLSASSPEVDFCFRFDGEKAGLVKAATPNAKFTEPIGEAGHDSSASSEAAFRVHVPPRSGEGASAGRAPIPLLRYSVAPTCRPIPLRLLPSWSRRQAPRPSVGVDGNGLGTPDDHALPPPVAALDLRLAANPSLAEGLSHVRVQATPPDGLTELVRSHPTSGGSAQARWNEEEGAFEWVWSPLLPTTEPLRLGVHFAAPAASADSVVVEAKPIPSRPLTAKFAASGSTASGVDLALADRAGAHLPVATIISRKLCRFLSGTYEVHPSPA
mmetsp:Transcript_16555/g.50884  ORF Transcript_16555/g.50884 Transcript_16555/m.50884 type:complete len:311 (+) Transcript_16555:1429-2361(+)